MQYMRHLDSIRALAIGAVMFEHFAGETLNSLVPIGAGALGVNLFFTLSGFLITGILLQNFDHDKQRVSTFVTLRNFYIRRFLRLAPILYITLIVLAFMQIGTIAQSWPWHAFYISNFYIVSGGEKLVFWSLAVEEQFYFVWPLIIIMTPRRYMIAACLALFCTGVVWKIFGYTIGIPQQSVNVMLPGSFEPLAVGCLLSTLSYRDGKSNQFAWLTPPRLRQFNVIAAIALGIALGITATAGRDSLLSYFVLDGLLAVVYGWVVMMGARGVSGSIGVMLNNGALVYIGKISYGLYIVHNWMPAIVEQIFGPMPKLYAAPIVLILTFGICAVSYRFIETPIRNLGSRLKVPPFEKPLLA